jgi:hypothetical protein
MANIREQDAPANLGLQPTEMGVDARAAVARRGGAFYQQAADAITGTGQRIASTVKDVGQQVNDYETHREINEGSAAFADLQLRLTNQWNETAKNSDPNDPTVAKKFLDGTVAPALEAFRGNFNTEDSQKFADQKVNSLRDHLFEKTAADQSTLAGIAVRKNINDATTSMSNTAILDPSSVPNLLAGVDHSIAGVVGSSPTLSATDAARVSGELSDATKKAIVHAGAVGALQKSSNPEATADEWIKKYPDYISGTDAKSLAGNARQQIRANNYDVENNRRRQKEVATDQSTEKSNQYLIDVRSQDPKLANDPTAKKILNDPTLLKADKNNLLNYIDRQLKPETQSALSQQSFVGLLRDLRAPDADPDKVMQKAWDARLMDPGKPGSLSEKDFNQFRQEVVARKTPEGAALEHDRASFFKNYADAITGGKGAYNPALGDPKVYNAEMDARRVETALKAKGLDPHLAYDPASPYFLGDPKRISKWSTSMQQDLSTMAAPKSVNLTAGDSKVTGITTENLPPITRDAPRTAGNTYMTPAGQMKWTGTGWVKP